VPVTVQENTAAVYATQICGYIYAFTAVVMPIGTAAKDSEEAFLWCHGRACPHVRQKHLKDRYVVGLCESL